MSILRCLSPCVLVAVLGAAQAVHAQGDEADERAPLRCISMRQIESTHVVDDQTILFYRRGGLVYMNVLDQSCPTLARNRLFRYRVNRGALTARVCDSDSITVVDLDTGSLTYHCRLGQFHPIELGRAEELLAAPRRDDALEIAPVELDDEAQNDDSGDER